MADSLFLVMLMDISSVLYSIKKEKTAFLPIKDLAPNPMQPRRRFDEDELCALSDSIKAYGVIQPIAVKKIEPMPFPMPKPSAKYEIIAGERRWRAAKMAGLTVIPCIVIEADRTDSAILALVENLQRSDLSYFEEAIAMQNLLLMTGKSQSEVARALSISQSTLSNKLRLLKLSERERLMAIENGFSERHCRALVRIESERERRPILLKIIKESLQSAETERLVEEYLSSGFVQNTSVKRKTKKQAFIKGSLKDMKMLFNTVDKAVRFLHTAGYSAEWCKQESGDSIEVRITVSRSD